MLDSEIIELVDEDHLELEVEQADTVRERISLGIIRIDEAINLADNARQTIQENPIRDDSSHRTEVNSIHDRENFTVLKGSSSNSLRQAKTLFSLTEEDEQSTVSTEPTEHNTYPSFDREYPHMASSSVTSLPSANASTMDVLDAYPSSRVPIQMGISPPIFKTPPVTSMSSLSTSFSTVTVTTTPSFSTVVSRSASFDGYPRPTLHPLLDMKPHDYLTDMRSACAPIPTTPSFSSSHSVVSQVRLPKEI
jgi:hypothetical protein